MKKYICLFFLLVFTESLLHASELKIYTEEMPPYNYQDTVTGQPVGFSVDIVKELLKRTGIKPAEGKINIYPWARAYHIIQNEKNVMLFSMTRTEAREDLFKWVGPIASRTVWFWKLKDRKDIIVNSLEDAKQYSVGGIYEFAISKYLLKQGFKVDMNISVELNWKKLFLHRIDLGTSLEIEAAYYTNKLGKSFKQLEKLIILDDRYDFYLAFNKKTSDDIVNQLQRGLNDMKIDGNYEKIRQTHLKE